ncbi:MAG TPA: thioredoxin [bacterium]|nr:thioredoxin [bacterium]
MAEKIFTDTNFETEIAGGVSLVDFWAPWCAPCRMQGPIVDRLAEKYAGKAKIGKMNVDENRNIPGKFGISGIPTILVFKNGVKVDQFVGVQQERILAAALDAQIS